MSVIYILLHSHLLHKRLSRDISEQCSAKEYKKNKDNLKNININIDMVILENINIFINIDMDFLDNINIDIDKGIWQNINIDKISNRLEFGVSNRANCLITWFEEENCKEEPGEAEKNPEKSLKVGPTRLCDVPGRRTRKVRVPNYFPNFSL